MTTENTSLTRTLDGAVTLASLLKQDVYANRFKEVMGERAPQFVSSLIAIGNTMKDVEPRSIIGAAMTAACLDLPIDKNLGFAWIVPYRTDGKKVGQFQIGYKGMVQLGLRSAQYQRMNATPINREVFKGWDAVGEPLLDWEQFSPEKEIWGYFFGFQLINGFTKTAVWTREKVIEHARRYSQSYRAKADIWMSQFDGMALKTVISNTLRKWGPLSIQMQQAFQSDQAVIRDIDATPEYIDGTGDEPERVTLTHPEKAKQEESTGKVEAKSETKAPVAETKAAKVESKVKKPETKAPEPEPEKMPETAPAAAHEPPNEETKQPANVVTMPAPTEAPTPTPIPTPEPTPAQEEKDLAAAGLAPEQPAEAKEPGQMTEGQKGLKAAIEAAGLQFEDLANFAAGKFLPKKTDPRFPKDYSMIDDGKASLLLRSVKGLVAGIKEAKSKKK